MGKLVFVYGTLMAGDYNHARFMREAKCIEATAVVDGLALYVPQHAGFPVAVRAAGFVLGEVWSVDDATMERLDAMECGAGYIRTRVHAKRVGGKARAPIACWAYVQSAAVATLLGWTRTDGSWREWKQTLRANFAETNAVITSKTRGI